MSDRRRHHTVSGEPEHPRAPRVRIDRPESRLRLQKFPGTGLRNQISDSARWNARILHDPAVPHFSDLTYGTIGFGAEVNHVPSLGECRHGIGQNASEAPSKDGVVLEHKRMRQAPEYDLLPGLDVAGVAAQCARIHDVLGIEVRRQLIGQRLAAIDGLNSLAY